MTLPAAAAEAMQRFAAAGGWEQRARLLMQWGERLEPLDDSERNEANRVQGCESQVWLTGTQQDGLWYYRAASEARLLRGLLTLLIERVNGLSAEELATLDLTQWFTDLGLARQLSPSRSNGLMAVLRRMRALSEQG
ncbi:SufE family protein [Stutzerimonas azotifigens]|uniref:SufE family protein n=1 Tax=Stutzerimonas azotifigens TaxID=291995 RepID=A0ABR5Z265_9GAMM|nr:SufE family protein [Stutzerimonas azotifigens]MBA1274283.1 SufE family protein [Stutzerimonas azotifigens]